MNPAPFSQVVVWPNTTCKPDEIEAFEAFVADDFRGTRVKFLKCVETTEVNVDGTKRVDLLFAIHEDDIPKFAVPRFIYGMRWLEDIYGNGHGHIYPAEIAELKSWD